MEPKVSEISDQDVLQLVDLFDALHDLSSILTSLRRDIIILEEYKAELIKQGQAH